MLIERVVHSSDCKYNVQSEFKRKDTTGSKEGKSC